MKRENGSLSSRKSLNSTYKKIQEDVKSQRTQLWKALKQINQLKVNSASWARIRSGSKWKCGGKENVAFMRAKPKSAERKIERQSRFNQTHGSVF